MGSASNTLTEQSAPHRFGPVRRIAPAAGLFFLSPFVAEFLLGNISVSEISALFFLAPMYGGGTLLVREVTRRTGHGWPTMILLGAAYAVIEEGLVTQTLFDPSYLGLHLLSFAPVPQLGMGAWWTVFVLTLHVVWSTSASIALAEALVPARSSQPWLGLFGTIVVAALFVLGATAVALGTHQSAHFMLSSAQLAGTIITIMALIALALSLGRRHPATVVRPAPDRPAPGPWLVGVVALAASSLFLGLNLFYARNWVTVGIYLTLDALVIGLVLAWSRRTGWTGSQVLALTGGALLAYAWHAFPEVPVLGAQGTTDLAGNAVFALITVGLLAAAALTRRRAARLAPDQSHAPHRPA